MTRSQQQTASVTAPILARLVQTAATVTPAAAAPASAVAVAATAGPGHKGGRHVRVWVDENGEEHEKDSSSAEPAGGPAMRRFGNRVSVLEQQNSGKGAVDAKSLQHHCSVALMVPGEVAKRQCVPPAVIDSALGISIIGEAGK